MRNIDDQVEARDQLLLERDEFFIECDQCKELINIEDSYGSEFDDKKSFCSPECSQRWDENNKWEYENDD